ncbi:putative hydro-lyase [Lachnospiraceae bacterium 54-53]
MGTEYMDRKPAEVRKLIREGIIDGPTTGMCGGYAQGNLVILPRELAWDFLLFCQRNPRACPLLEVSDAGSRTFPLTAKGSDIARDLPKYRIYENGTCTGEYTDVSEIFEDYQNTRGELVSFLIGCSFSFETELLEAGIPVRQIEEGVNVPMYNTNIPCAASGVFSGNMVVSMRPIPHRQIPAAVAITAAMPRVHGAPVQIGFPEAIGIRRLEEPDYGDKVTIKEGEAPVFWPCGVTPQAVVMNSRPSFVITHAPGHMFITDIKNAELKY